VRLPWQRRITDERPLASSEELQRADRKLRLDLKESYGKRLLFLLACQLVAANALMFVYAARGYHWMVPNSVMQAWLAATVVELIGVVYVIVSHLFPRNEVH
jgi:hypothetical protein